MWKRLYACWNFRIIHRSFHSFNDANKWPIFIFSHLIGHFLCPLIEMDWEPNLQSLIIMLFQQEEVGTWILPDEALVVEGNTISVTDQAQSFPVCALSSGNLRKGLFTYCRFLNKCKVNTHIPMYFIIVLSHQTRTKFCHLICAIQHLKTWKFER